MRELIQLIAYELVDNPGKVTIDIVAGSHTNVLELKVAKEDIGKVIGKNGCSERRHSKYSGIPRRQIRQ